MAQFGWAYVNCTSSGGDTVDGPTGSVLLLYGDSAASGSANFTFITSSNNLFLTGAFYVNGAVTASGHVSASGFTGDGSGLTGIAAGGSTGYASFSSNFIVSASYDVIGIDCTGSIITASLPLASALDAGKRFVFKDVSGSANTYAIAIEPSGSDVIDGSTGGVTISVNYGAVTLAADSVGAYYIIGIRD